MDEATALLSTLEATPPRAPTACDGWTAHDLVAHLAAGAEEMASLTEATLGGRPGRATRGFEDREAPFAAMDDDDLRQRLLTEALRLNAAVDALGAAGRAVWFSGRPLTAAELTMHGRSEAALHRWDLAGDDDISRDLLSPPELTAHAIGVLNAMDVAEGVAGRADAAGIGDRLVFASPGQLDVVIVTDPDGTRLELQEPRAARTATADPATRLLALWGRRTTIGPVGWEGDDETCSQLARFCWPSRAG